MAKTDIRDTFKKFKDKDITFFQMCCGLFESIGISIKLRMDAPLKFMDMYNQRTPFAKDPKWVTNVIDKVANSYYIGNINDATLQDHSKFDSEFYEQREHGNYQGMMVFAVEAKEGITLTRTECASLTRAFNRLAKCSPVILIIHQGDTISIAQCNRVTYIPSHLQPFGEKLGKVTMLRDINLAKTHTGHFNILEKMDFSECNTFNDVYDHWHEVFSTKLLTKEFYNELFNWYQWAISDEIKVTYPNSPYTTKDDRDVDKNIIRLITRLIFVWFLRAKNLVPTNLFKEEFLDTILVDFNPVDRKSSIYYNAILQNLFFATLNQEIDKRSFADNTKGKKQAKDFDINNLFRDNNNSTYYKITPQEVLQLFSKIPYLNGGLFECLDGYAENGKHYYSDGFSREEGRQRRAFVPNILFFDKGRGLINILKRYYFTIEENTPLEQEVSLDPELLGKVFENLLGAYNPETKETERKTSGSFYTPREIVEYMSNESITNYLSTHIYKDDKELRTDYEHRISMLLNYSAEEPTFSEDEIESTLNLIYNCKILDPACGSGAFPMGVMQRLVHILSFMDKDNKRWKQLLKDKAKGQTNNAWDIEEDGERNLELERIKDSFDESIRRPDYARKLFIIQKCIYCSDIQDIAIQISKLRFFISLVCDITPDYNKKNFGIPTLPNLEAKFVCADSLKDALIRKYDNIENEKNVLNLGFAGDKHLYDLRKDLEQSREDFFYANTYKRKKKAREDERNKRSEIAEYLKEKFDNYNNVEIDLNKEQIKKYKKELESIHGEKWIEKEEVTEATLFEPAKKTKVRYDENERTRKYLTDSINYCKFRIKDLEDQKFQYDNAVKQIANWDLYDKLNTAEFFYPQWMFGVKDFDIVIGNPPYIQLQKDSPIINKETKKNIKYGEIYRDCQFWTFDKTGDIYCLFYERAHQLLKNDGICCFITSNKWMRTAYGQSTRKFFSDNTNPKLLIDFVGVKVFDSATVDTNILLYQKSKNIGHTQCCATKGMTKVDMGDMTKFVNDNSTDCAFHSSGNWIIQSPIEQSIQYKINLYGKPLKEWNIDIYRGILTGYNDAFIISTDKREEILAGCKDKKERIRTEELIRPVIRGRDVDRYSYNWADLWLINTHNGIKNKLKRIDINDYPSTKKYLDSFDTKLENRADQGETFYNLRNCAYLEVFAKPKIIWKRIGSILRFSYDETGIYSLDSTCIATGSNLKYLCCFLNSKMGHYLMKDAPKTGTGDLLVSVQAIEPLKVAKPVASMDNLLDLQLDSFSSDTDQKINSEIYKLYHLTDVEINYIESYK